MFPEETRPEETLAGHRAGRLAATRPEARPTVATLPVEIALAEMQALAATRSVATDMGAAEVAMSPEALRILALSR
jgi:hypothetical protein